MSPAIIPGTLFIVLLALTAFLNKDPDVIFVLALGCALGWLSQLEDITLTLRTTAYFAAIVMWTAATLLLFTRII